MMKVSLLACLILVFPAFSYGLLWKPFNANCTKPDNLVHISMVQLPGYWYMHQIVNYGDYKIDKACTRMDFHLMPDRKSAIGVDISFLTTTGQLFPEGYELSHDSDKVIRLTNMRNQKHKLYYYPLKFNGRYFVASMCITYSGMHVAQPVVIMTMEKDEDATRLENEIKSTGVVIEDSYTVPRDENCFKYEAPV